MTEQMSETPDPSPSPLPERQTDISQQATNTSLPPQEKTRVKNSKRVAAGKLVAVKTEQAHEPQKKNAAAKAAVIIANDKAKKAKQRVQAPPSERLATEDEHPDAGHSSSMPGLSTAQWLMVGSIMVLLIGLYYKRDELKTGFRALIQKPPSQQTVALSERKFCCPSS